MQIQALPLWALVAGCGWLAAGCGEYGGDPADPAGDLAEDGNAGDAGGQQPATSVNASGAAGQQSAGGGAAGKAIGGSGGASGGGAGGTKSLGGGGGSLDAGGEHEAGRDLSSRDGEGDLTIAAPYSSAPELTVRADVPHGTLHDFNLSSTASAIYPVEFTNKMPFGRNVSVYVPKQYVAGSAAPFIVVQDGISFYRSTMVPVLDNMINDQRLPIMIAIFIEPGPNGPTPEGERSFEYDTVSDAYVRFIETEILPKVQKDYSLKLTTDPDGRATMGGSSGGAAAFTMGWFRPDLYHRVLTYSGSFCDLQPTASHPHGAWEYHESLIANDAVKPLRVALEVGQNDGNWNTATDMNRNWVTANRAMAAALAARGYHYRFVYALGAGHVDAGVLHQTLPETLAWLWQGYAIP